MRGECRRLSRIPPQAGRFGKVCALGGVPLVTWSSHSPEIVVYWRPGCPFCSSLLRQFDKRGVPHHRVNIWQDPAAAATVRSFARGNETVPTTYAISAWYRSRWTARP
ncbi:MAG: glutaredoxin domain-containing protein [Acidimicrobiales bacterium]